MMCVGGCRKVKLTERILFSDESSHPLLDPFEHGWMRDTVDKILTPVMLPTSVPLPPDYISTMIKCSREHFGSARSSNVSSALPCTGLCLSSRNHNVMST